jgi:phosphoglycerate dehydrogenase-like enzyme
MQKTLQVHILKASQTNSIDLLKQKLEPNISVSFSGINEIPGETSILVAGEPTNEILAALPNLKSLIVPWAGVAPETFDLMRKFPHISIHNLHHNALPVAEYALALLLSAANMIIPVDRALRANDWRPRYTHTASTLISGKTVVILGYGNIGKALSKLLTGFDMTIMATRNSVNSSHKEDSVQIFPANSLHSLLLKADFLIVTLPLTPFTKGLIGEKELSLLPKNAVIVNIGRGDIIDQPALYKALKERPTMAAGIDVWYNYPKNDADRLNTPPADYPFQDLDNIVMSPHRAGSLNQTDIEVLRMTHLAELLNQAAHGNTMSNLVDPEKGY